MRNNQSGSNSSLEKKFESIYGPFKEFISDQKTSNALLFLATILAIFLANSPWQDSYFAFNETKSGIFIGDLSLIMTNQEWINDGLMAMFFYIIGLEVKRELLVGELTSLKNNITILAAALGGMIFPALIYHAFNHGLISEQGWGIPMATDTAFAVGVLAILGKRVPAAATTFLMALAIFDDLGAVLVIAFFYVDGLNLFALYEAGVIFLLMLVMNRLGVRSVLPYLTGGVLLWISIHNSGIHASISGVLAALTVPSRPKHDASWFVRKMQALILRFQYVIKKSSDDKPFYNQTKVSTEDEEEIINSIEHVAETSTTPLQRWEKSVRRPIALFVLPLFALSNAGININMEVLPDSLASASFWGVFLGLILGKSFGIGLFTWIVIHYKIGTLPGKVTLQHIIGIGLLGGMGFTMSIFIASIGFGEMQETLQYAKTAILSGSLMAGVLGYSWLLWLSKQELSKKGLSKQEQSALATEKGEVHG